MSERQSVVLHLKEGKMLGFYTDWGNGERTFILVGFVIFVLCLATFIRQRNRSDRFPNVLLVGFLVLAMCTLIGMTSEKGRREEKETRSALSQYDWAVVRAGDLSQVQIGECIVDLRRVKLDGDNSLFAIGQEPQAQRLGVIYPRVLELCP